MIARVFGEKWILLQDPIQNLPPQIFPGKKSVASASQMSKTMDSGAHLIGSLFSS
jgi:hypothetical protein